MTLLDTGLNSMTGGRGNVQRNLLEMTMLTYGDGVCDVNIKDLVNFHKSNNTKAIMTVKPAEDSEHWILTRIVNEFVEKPRAMEIG